LHNKWVKTAMHQHTH